MAAAYDPVENRFLSCDPVMQDPSNAINHNRYAYCLNNPLKYTDPSGKDYYTEMVSQGGTFFYRGSYVNAGPLTTGSGRVGGSGGLPGEAYNGVRNGNGANGVYFDWKTGTHRSVDDFGIVDGPVITAGDINKKRSLMSYLSVLKQYNSRKGLLASLGGVGKPRERWLSLGEGKPTLWINEGPNDPDDYGGQHEIVIRVYGGMLVDFKYNDYNWVHTTVYDGTEMKDGRNSDGFMYGEINSGWRNNLAGTYQADADMFFWDRPNAKHDFEGFLTLVGRVGNQWEAIQSFTWGYSIDTDGNVYSRPLEQTNIPIPSSHYNYLINAIFTHNH